MIYSARRNRPWIAVGGSVLCGAVVLWGLRHVQNIMQAHYGHARTFTLIYAVTFAALVWQMLLYVLERPYTVDREQKRRLRMKRIVANVPVCNEDPTALVQCLASLLRQNRRIDQIQVVVNGPNTVDYTKVEAWAGRVSKETGVPIDWVTQEIAGKRHAQATTARAFLLPDDLLLTVDSDAYLDAHAVEELIKPFSRPEVMSAAGVVLTMNNRASFLTRMSDLLFQTWQLTDRSANSTLGAVLVNSGVLAVYRGHLLLDNLAGYTSETFFGRPVQFSDDSMLTLYALKKGKAVQQPTSFAFTLMPENVNHHIRQQVRWARGSFIRSWWRFKYLPLTGYAYWSHLLRWIQVFLSAMTFLYLFIWSPIMTRAILPYLLIVPLALGYGQALRYFAVSRSDESFLYRLGTWICTPIPALWSFFVLRFVRYYGIATCLRTGWGTRAQVEVKA